MRIRIVLAVLGILFLVFVMSFSPPADAQPSLFLTGRVVSKSSGKPISSVWVEVIKSGELVGRSLTGNDGKYYISGLEEGSYEVVVVKRSHEVFKGPLQLTESRHFDIEI